jgi:hypothetical protein
MGFPASREGMRAAAAAFRAAFPDWHSDIGFYVEEGDLAVLRLRDAEPATAAMRAHLARVSGHLLGTG